MNNNYFRVTAYHKQANVSMIIDSNGYFDALWKLSALLVEKGFDILEVGKSDTFSNGNIPPVEINSENLIMRACKMGKPEYTENDKVLDVHGRYYAPNKR